MAASRVHPFCNLQSRARTHALLVIGLYELFGNPTTELIETPGPLQEIESSKYNLAARTASSTGFLNVNKSNSSEWSNIIIHRTGKSSYMRNAQDLLINRD